MHKKNSVADTKLSPDLSITSIENEKELDEMMESSIEQAENNEGLPLDEAFLELQNEVKNIKKVISFFLISLFSNVITFK